MSEIGIDDSEKSRNLLKDCFEMHWFFARKSRRMRMNVEVEEGRERRKGNDSPSSFSFSVCVLGIKYVRFNYGMGLKGRRASFGAIDSYCFSVGI